MILCEGYYDRAFWGGWLRYLGCTDPGERPDGRGRLPVLDPWGDRVVRGQFAYQSPRQGFLRVVPCHGYENVLPAARDRLGERAFHGLEHLVVNVDPDTDATAQEIGPTGLRASDLLREVRQFDGAAQLESGGYIGVDGGKTKVWLVRWEVQGGQRDGVPSQQTLERVICAALAAAYPNRAAAVHQWLDSRPDRPDRDPKEHAWSFMAGWYAEKGCEFFFRDFWHDPPVVAHLKPILQACGAWSVAETVVSSSEPPAT